MVRDWYTKNGPYALWDDPAVESLFVVAAKPPLFTSNPTSPPNPSTPPSDSNTSTGAIAGSVVGGIGWLAAVAAIVYYVLHRRRHDGPIIEHGKPGLEATVKTNSRGSTHEAQLIPVLELPDTALLELPSGEQRHTADVTHVRERYEME